MPHLRIICLPDETWAPNHKIYKYLAWLIYIILKSRAFALTHFHEYLSFSALHVGKYFIRAFASEWRDIRHHFSPLILYRFLLKALIYIAVQNISLRAASMKHDAMPKFDDPHDKLAFDAFDRGLRFIWISCERDARLSNSARIMFHIWSSLPQ